MRQQVWGAIQIGAAAIRYCVTEVFGVPVDDGGGQEVQPSHAEVLTFGCPVADFALAANAQGILEADLGATLHIGIEQPIDDEERPLDPSDFPECHCQLVLPRIRREFTQ